MKINKTIIPVPMSKQVVLQIEEKTWHLIKRNRTYDMSYELLHRFAINFPVKQDFREKFK